MNRFLGKAALVTGANSGIGAAITRNLVKNGMRVIGADKSNNALEEMSKELSGEKGSLTPVLCDVTKDSDVESLFHLIEQNHKAVHVLINNAGIIDTKNILDGNPKMWRSMLDVNLVSLCYCSKLSVELMKKDGIDDGHIINMASIAGHKVFPFVEFPNSHFYSVTKFGVVAATEGIRQELRAMKSKIRITVISPGLVRTNIINQSLGVSDKELDKILGSKAIAILDPQNIADTVLHVLERPPNVQINEVVITATEQR